MLLLLVLQAAQEALQDAKNELAASAASAASLQVTL